MRNCTLAPGTKPVYQSADKKWIQSTCLEFTWQCSQVLWLQAGPTISSKLYNRTICWFFSKRMEAKHSEVSWCEIHTGFRFLNRLCLRASSLGQVCGANMAWVYLYIENTHPCTHRTAGSSTVGTFKAGICDGAEITIEAKDAQPVVFRSRHTWPGGCWALLVDGEAAGLHPAPSSLLCRMYWLSHCLYLSGTRTACLPKLKRTAVLLLFKLKRESSLSFVT